MGSAGMKQQQGEKRVDFIKRVQAAQAEERAAREAMLPRKKARKTKRSTSNRVADRVDGFDRDDIGESHD